MNTRYIYKLCSTDPNVTDVYIGSTKNIRQRKIKHKYMCNNPNARSHNLQVYQFIRSRGGFENWDIIVLQEVRHNHKYELRKYERDKIEELNSTLNIKKPSELSYGNCDGKIEYCKQYYQQNRTNKTI